MEAGMDGAGESLKKPQMTVVGDSGEESTLSRAALSKNPFGCDGELRRGTCNVLKSKWCFFGAPLL